MRVRDKIANSRPSTIWEDGVVDSLIYHLDEYGAEAAIHWLSRFAVSTWSISLFNELRELGTVEEVIEEQFLDPVFEKDMIHNPW